MWADLVAGPWAKRKREAGGNEQTLCVWGTWLCKSAVVWLCGSADWMLDGGARARACSGPVVQWCSVRFVFCPIMLTCY